MRCGFCASEFRVRAYRVSTAKYCSLHCKSMAQKGKPSWRKGKRHGEMRPCKTCGEKFYCYPSQMPKRQYCSMRCRNADPDRKTREGMGSGLTKVKGYVYQKAKHHPNKNSQGYVMQHRLVTESPIGRFLVANEEVHHKNGVKDDNRIENLEIVLKKTHFGQVQCPHCQKGFKIK